MKIQPVQFAGNLMPGDVIDAGQSYPCDLIDVEHLDDGMVRLVWGVTAYDAKTVSSFTGIIYLGHFEALTDV